tara:strand:+ start:33 stop:242 length:210 start_codon:yes stop_codon:yes gene_type:complete
MMTSAPIRILQIKEHPSPVEYIDGRDWNVRSIKWSLCWALALPYEEQILITEAGYEMLSTFPVDEDLLA